MPGIWAKVIGPKYNKWSGVQLVIPTSNCIHHNTTECEKGENVCILLNMVTEEEKMEKSNFVGKEKDEEVSSEEKRRGEEREGIFMTELEKENGSDKRSTKVTSISNEPLHTISSSNEDRESADSKIIHPHLRGSRRGFGAGSAASCYTLQQLVFTRAVRFQRQYYQRLWVLHANLEAVSLRASLTAPTTPFQRIDSNKSMPSLTVSNSPHHLLDLSDTTKTPSSPLDYTSSPSAVSATAKIQSPPLDYVFPPSDASAPQHGFLYIDDKVSHGPVSIVSGAQFRPKRKVKKPHYSKGCI